MTRHSMLPSARLVVVVLGLSGVLALPITAWSQDRSTEERLDRLERDLNMLQRQVYRGVAPTVMSGDPNASADVEIRMDRLEGEMRDLTGRVEEFANQVEVLRQRLEQINNDIEMRFSQAAGPPGVAVPPPPGRRQTAFEPPSPAGGGLTPAPGGAIAPGTVVPAPTPIFGMLTPPGATPSGAAAPPPEMASSGPSGAGAPAPGLPSGSAAEQYNYALGLLKQADYAGAEKALREFIQQHPDHPKAGAAQYWIGETYFARGKFAEAAAAFAEGYKRYPKGPEAADDLLRLSMSLARVRQRDNACVALAQLDRDFPNPAAKIKERAAAEKKRLGC
jgi:tol-pal system protein YbgF